MFVERLAPGAVCRVPNSLATGSSSGEEVCLLDQCTQVDRRTCSPGTASHPLPSQQQSVCHVERWEFNLYLPEPIRTALKQTHKANRNNRN